MKIDYFNVYIHFIFVTVNRLPLILEKNRVRIEKYVTGIVNNHDSRMYAVYANPEHMHFATSKSPKLSEEVLATIVAESSQKFINENRLCVGNFSWQESCAAFSVSRSDVDKVCKYILNQPEHHKKVSFAQEYDELMRQYQKGLRWG